MTADAYMETCLVSIAKQGGLDVHYQSLIESVDIDLGDKDIEGIPLVNGGRVTKFNPEEDSTITLEVYPMEIGTHSGTTGHGFVDLIHTADTSQPMAITNTRERIKYRMVLLWTEDTSVIGATASCGTAYYSERLSLADGYFTSIKPSFTDKIKKWTVTFKTTPYDKTGASNLKFESADYSAMLPASGEYTAANKF